MMNLTLPGGETVWINPRFVAVIVAPRPGEAFNCIISTTAIHSDGGMPSSLDVGVMETPADVAQKVTEALAG